MKKRAGFQETLKRLRDDWTSELKVAGFLFERVGKMQFQQLLRTLIAPHLNNSEWPKIAEDESTLLSEAMTDPSMILEVHDRAINFSITDDLGDEQSVHAVLCELSGYPNKKTPWALWQTPDLFANLLHLN